MYTHVCILVNMHLSAFFLHNSFRECEDPSATAYTGATPSFSFFRIRDREYFYRIRYLLDRHALGEVPGLVDVAAASDGDVIGEKLQRDDAHER